MWDTPRLALPVRLIRVRFDASHICEPVYGLVSQSLDLGFGVAYVNNSASLAARRRAVTGVFTSLETFIMYGIQTLQRIETATAYRRRLSIVSQHPRQTRNPSLWPFLIPLLIASVSILAPPPDSFPHKVKDERNRAASQSNESQQRACPLVSKPVIHLRREQHHARSPERANASLGRES
jgi:hypothetical protein